MECHVCGTSLPDDARYCAQCGEDLYPDNPGAAPPLPPAPVRPEPAPIELSGGPAYGEDGTLSFEAPAPHYPDPFSAPAASQDAVMFEAPVTPETAEAAETVVDMPMPDWQPEVQTAEAPPPPAFDVPAGFTEPGPEPGYVPPSEAHEPAGLAGEPEPQAGPHRHEPYHDAYVRKEDEPEPDKAEIERTLVGSNYEKFRPAFDKFRARAGFAASWCWPAFLFGMWWYLYRRMYAWIAIDIAMFAVVIPILSAVFLPMLSLAVLWPVARGLLAKHSYYKRIQKKTETARHDYKNESMKRHFPAGFRGYLATVGGPLNIAYVLVPAAAFVVFGFFIGGILAAIAIPNILKYQAKAKQEEVKYGLKALHEAQEEFFAKNGSYAKDFGTLGLDQSNYSVVYCYYLSENEAAPGGCDNYEIVDGVEAWVSDDAYVAVAIGNIDSDPDQDVWAIDQSGTLYTIQDDVMSGN